LPPTITIDKRDHVAVLGQAEPAPSRSLAGLVGRGEAFEVNARLHDLDPSGRSIVHIDQLASFGRRIGDQAVGLGHHLLLADNTSLGLGLVAVGQQPVLDLRKSVGGVHQRHHPPILGQRADLTGQPVVRVHQVVVAGRPGRLGTQYAVGEGAHLSRQFFLGQALERPRRDMPDRDARSHLDTRRQIAAGGSSEDLDLDAERRKPSRHLDDVDVHAAGVAGAGLV